MPRSRDGADTLSREGAERLATTIMIYWLDRGWWVRPNVLEVDVRDLPPDHRAGVVPHVVRSEMINGIPRRRLT